MRNVLFENLPPRRRRPADDDGDFYDDADREFREILFFEPEGPLPVRRHRAGGGGVPIALVAPAVTGTATVGSTLTCSTGTWSNSPTGYAYQWLRNGSPIAGATASTYLLATADHGTLISCSVSATNALGAGSQVSNAVAVP